MLSYAPQAMGRILGGWVCKLAVSMQPTNVPDFSRQVHCLLGLPFDAVTLSETVARLEDAAARRTSMFLSTPNLNFLVACQTDAEFRNSVVHSDLSVADGMPIVWLARLLGVPITERVAGSTLFESLRQRPTTGARRPLAVYFFGGPEGAARAANERLNQPPHAGLRGVGYASPGFGSIADMSSTETISHINQSNADFVVVALGARKGQAWIEHNHHQLHAPIVSHLGAVVNMVAGTIARAPVWMQRTGLEWLWRVREEPALWRRYLNDGTTLIRLIFTRVLPLAWILRASGPTVAELSVAQVHSQSNGNTVLITLTGPWTSGNLDPLRDILQRTSLQPADVMIDLGAATFADSAVFGLLMLLRAHQDATNNTLRFAAVSSKVRRLGSLYGANWLWEEAK